MREPREERLKCPKCRLHWEPARLSDFRWEKAGDGTASKLVKVLLPKVRCLDCKTVYDRPLPAEVQ